MEEWKRGRRARGRLVTTDRCPLCGTGVALLRREEARNETMVLRDRIATFRRRVDELEQGDTTPRQLRDEMLWVCPECQRIMSDLRTLDREELQRRIRNEIKRLERRVNRVERRVS